MQRTSFLDQISAGFRTSKIVALLGPRQCGKTTLARQYFANQAGSPECYFDAENPTDLLRLQDPLLALESLSGLIVIDEVQRIPELFPVLRVLVDRQQNNQQYLILGSASRELIRQSSESLAGRIEYIELTPFSLYETKELNKLWVRGGFPRAFLAENDVDSMTWRRNYIRTFLEQDIPNLGFQIPPENLRRFWTMLAHYHGQLLNASELGNAMDLSHNTIKRYLDILSGTFMIRQLAPWHENIAKRQVKSPKIYFRDSGILHALLNVPDEAGLHTQPKVGASWEGFAMESLIRNLKIDANDCYFWATHAHAELDLLIVQGMEKIGFEFKFTKVPKLTKSMQIAMDDLKLKALTIIYPGEHPIKLARNITCIGLSSLATR